MEKAIIGTRALEKHKQQKQLHFFQNQKVTQTKHKDEEGQKKEGREKENIDIVYRDHCFIFKEHLFRNKNMPIVTVLGI